MHHFIFSLQLQDGLVRVLRHFKHTNSAYIMPEIVVKSISKANGVYKEIIRFG